nr:hypothetical protein CFP56_16890 [Quercus suber]
MELPCTRYGRYVEYIDIYSWAAKPPTHSRSPSYSTQGTPRTVHQTKWMNGQMDRLGCPCTHARPVRPRVQELLISPIHRPSIVVSWGAAKQRAWGAGGMQATTSSSPTSTGALHHSRRYLIQYINVLVGCRPCIRSRFGDDCQPVLLEQSSTWMKNNSRPHSMIGATCSMRPPNFITTDHGVSADTPRTWSQTLDLLYYTQPAHPYVRMPPIRALTLSDAAVMTDADAEFSLRRGMGREAKLDLLVKQSRRGPPAATSLAAAECDYPSASDLSAKVFVRRHAATTDVGPSRPAVSGSTGRHPRSPFQRTIPSSTWVSSSMNAIRALLGWRSKTPSTLPFQHEDDEVYPLHPLDDTKAARTIVSWLMRFDDVLDAGQLHDALTRLLAMGDWRKLGGRMRHKRQDPERIELHVPRSYSLERPAVTYYHDNLHDTRLDEHPVAKTFPAATSGPSVQPQSADLQPLVAPPGMRATYAEMVDGDVPQLSLRITSFSDATLVAISWPHSLMDASGTHALLHAWSLVLAGRAAEIPPLLGAREDRLPDVLNGVKVDVREEYALEPLRLTGFGMLLWFYRFFRDMLWNAALETRTIFLPKAFFAHMKRQVQEELALAAATGEKDVFVSESDVISAWITRMVALTEPTPRPITLVSALNARFRLQLPDSSNGTYIQNMLIPAYVFFSAEVAAGPLAPITLAHRQHLVQQASAQQVMSVLRIWFRDIERKRSSGLLFGDSNALPLLSNNLTKIAVIRAVDFSPAVSRPREPLGTANTSAGKMTTFAVTGAPKKLNFFEILGKDHDDNYWMNAVLRPRTWARIEQELRVT